MASITNKASFSGRDLAVAAFKDLESFFFYSSKFEVKHELEVNICSLASYIGSGASSRIRVSKDFCSYSNNSLDKYFFSLFVISHELAHYLNFHNSHRDRNRDDTVAIEARADNMGAQIFATIITFGKRTKANLKNINPDINQFVLAENIGSSLGSLYSETFFPNKHPSYPDPTHRIFSMIAGLLSFFNRLFGHLPENWTMWFLLTLLRSSDLLSRTNPEDALNGSEEILDNIYEIHRNLQDREPLMRYGVKPPYGLFLFSNFQQSEKERKEHRARLEQMVERFDIFQSSVPETS
ncbi:hypothetical protein [Methylomicrobium lacus]|uniref:hypothetical protein n=1 Tax=Methylomicrobium lacus TaxID=136992 RepID=UPI0035A82FF6